MLATLEIVIIGKPLAAFMVMLFRRPLRSALSISVALAQIGEFSFILAALASSLNILPSEAANALVVASVAPSLSIPCSTNASSRSFAG
jgi:CPA2 family monovalent cation:H+ antiporter-2